MKKNIIKAFLCFTTFSVSLSTYAQVTIGGNAEPQKGTLIQLQQESQTNGKANAKKGLLMPRVELLSTVLNSTTYKNLANTIKNASGTWDAKEHIGLAVYNLTNTPNQGLCPGLYTWNGEEWISLKGSCLGEFDLSITPQINKLYFSSGINNTITPQTITVAWEPSTPTISVTRTKNTDLPAGTKVEELTSFNPALPSSLTGGNSTITIKPTPFAVSSNLFRSSEAKITISGTHNSQTRNYSIIANQTNKAITVDGATSSISIPATTNMNKSFTVESNAVWHAYVTPATGGSIINITQRVGGKELYDGTALKQTVSFNISPAPYRYSSVTFTDTKTPKRFQDIIISVTNCSATKDLSMEEYKDIWEKMYGLTVFDEPDSNGNEVLNPNKVQWHRDQSGNIFFSAMFGNQRWMITNLAATEFAKNLSSSPNLLNGYNVTETGNNIFARMGYSKKDPTIYRDNPRIGLLYNWYAATGKQNQTNIDQANDATLKVQGICPENWHLPNGPEIKQMLSIITGTTGRDSCESIGGIAGTSPDFLKGGFSSIMPGVISQTSGALLLNEVHYWSSASANPAGILPTAYGLYMGTTSPSGFTFSDKYRRIAYASVRCIRD